MTISRLFRAPAAWNISILVVALGALAAASVLHERSRAAELFHQEAQDLATTMAAQMPGEMHRLDVRALRSRLRALRTDSALRSAWVTDTEGIVLADATEENERRDRPLEGSFATAVILSRAWISAEQDSVLDVGGPIRGADGEILGYLMVSYSTPGSSALRSPIPAVAALCMGLGTAGLWFATPRRRHPVADQSTAWSAAPSQPAAALTDRAEDDASSRSSVEHSRSGAAEQGAAAVAAGRPEELEALEQERALLAEERDRLARERSLLQEENRQAALAFEQGQAELRARQDRSAALEADLSAAQQALSAAGERLRELDAVRQELDSRVIAAEMARTALQQELRLVRQELDRTSEEGRELEQRLLRSGEDREREMEGLRLRGQRAERERESTEQRLHASEQELARARDELALLQERSATERQQLRQELEAAEQRRRDAEAALERLEDERRGIVEDLSRMTHEHDRLQHFVEDLQVGESLDDAPADPSADGEVTGAAPLPEVSDSEPVIDRQEALAGVDGDVNFLGTLIGIFIESYPRQLADIRAAIERQDAVSLGRAARMLKGVVETFGAKRAAPAASRLEALARRGDLSAAADACAVLESEIERLRPHLEELRSVPSAGSR